MCPGNTLHIVIFFHLGLDYYKVSMDDKDLELPESARLVETPSETQFLAALGVVRYFDISCLINYICIHQALNVLEIIVFKCSFKAINIRGAKCFEDLSRFDTIDIV